MEFTIRKAVPDDLPAALQMIREATEKMNDEGIAQWDEIYPDRDILDSDIRNGEMHILLSEGTPAAIIILNEQQYEAYQTASWKYIGAKVLVIHRLCVKPSYQGQGIAKRLLAYAEEYARAHGYGAIRLDAFPKNPYALRLYEWAGYEKAGIVHFRKGEFYCYEKLIK